MNRPLTRLWITLWAISSASALSAPIRNLAFTEVIKDVSVIDAVTKKETPAKVGDVLVPPNVLKTGGDSRAELVAEDKTVTRIGANTVFSVEPNSRDVNLTQGSVLFHSPTGKGGGNIKSAGATASVLGTTLAVNATSNGGIKTSLLEGVGKMAGKGGNVTLKAGQVSFAMPNQKFSRPLNFDLKAMVDSSKLVNGFPKPIASIGKINAEVSKQQAKIASGQLGVTELVIGDRPDTAFKLDATTVTTVISIQQEVQKAQETASRKVLDPRYIEFVSNLVSLTKSISTPTAPADNIFSIDGSGANKETGYGLPINIPGNREGEGAHSTIIAGNISFDVPTSGPDLGYFVATPVNVPVDTKNGAVVALNNIIIGKSIEFVGLMAPSNLPETFTDPTTQTTTTLLSEQWTPLNQWLLSAGNSIAIKPGSVLRADVPLFEIYAAGTSFSADINLSQSSTPGTPLDPTTLWQNSQSLNAPSEITPPYYVLDWKGVAVVNGYTVDDSASTPYSGRLRITAPSIRLTNSVLRAGDITVNATNDLVITREATPTVLPLGFESAKDLSAYGIHLNSAQGSVSITNANIWSSQLDILANNNVTLTGVTTESDFVTSTPTGTVDPSVVQPPAFSTDRIHNITATNGDITLMNVDIRAVTGIDQTRLEDQKLEVNLTAPKGNVTIGDPSLDTVAATANKVTTRAFRISAEGQVIGSITSGPNNGYTVSGKGNIVVNGLTHIPDADGTATSFSAKATNDILVKNANLSQIQNVAIAGNTVILSDTTFNANAPVNITTTTGKVAADPGYGNTAKSGMLNFIKNVFNGSTEVKFLTSGLDMANNAEFQASANRPVQQGGLGQDAVKNITSIKKQ